MLRSIFSFILFLPVISISAQTGSIQGFIIDEYTERPIEGAKVEIPALSLESYTNSEGFYLLEDVPNAKHIVIVSHLSFDTKKQMIELTSGQILELIVPLQLNVSDLPEIVVQGTGLTASGTRIKEIPGSVHFISPEEIEKFSYTDINQTLRSVPGLNLQEEDGFGLRPNIGIRGTGVERSSKITVMEDGILAAPAPYAAPAAYYFPTIGLMEGVEILKGSSQIKYGPYTTGGAINLITNKIPGQLSGRVNILGGSFGGNNVHALVGNTHGQLGYSIETFNYSSNGFKELEGHPNTGFDKQDYRLKLRWLSKDVSKVPQALLLKLGYAEEISNETYLGLTSPDFQVNPFFRYKGSEKDQMVTDQRQLSVRHFIRPSARVNITTTLYHNEFARNWYKLDKVTDSLGTNKIANILDDPMSHIHAYQMLNGANSEVDALAVKANNRSYYSRGIESKLEYTFGNESLAHALEIGMRLHEDQIDRFQWVDDYQMINGSMSLTTKGIPGTESNRIETANAFAAYIQHQFKTGQITLTPGLRYENVRIERWDYGKEDTERTGTELSKRSNGVNVFIPGMGINYRISEKTTAFAGIHKGFAPPGSQEDTDPEQSVNYELGYRFEDEKINGEIIGFYSDYSNLLGSDLAAAGGGGTTDLFNGGEAEVYGIESKFGLTLYQNNSIEIPLTVVYTYTHAYFNNSFESEFEGWGNVSEGDDLPYLAPHQLGAFLSIEHDQFNFNLSAKYLAEMRTEPGQGEIRSDSKTDEVLTFDASAHYHLSRNVDLFSNVINMTNEIYVIARRPAGLRPGLPRVFNFGIKARF